MSYFELHLSKWDILYVVRKLKERSTTLISHLEMSAWNWISYIASMVLGAALVDNILSCRCYFDVKCHLKVSINIHNSYEDIEIKKLISFWVSYNC